MVLVKGNGTYSLSPLPLSWWLGWEVQERSRCWEIGTSGVSVIVGWRGEDKLEVTGQTMVATG